MQNYLVNLSCKAPISFRTQKAANSVDLNLEEKLSHELSISADTKEDYSIGLILGASGSGKTTLAKKIFGENCLISELDQSAPIIDQFDKKYTYDECVDFLTGVGLTSIPCWIKPVYTLSNGQKARAEIALQVANKPITEEIVIDEWTSVVDRTVAKIMSQNIKKLASKIKRKITLISCHYDVIEWLSPDWVIDCNTSQYVNYRRSLWQRTEQLEFTIKEVSKESWKYFSKYHYLSKRLPGGKIHTYGLFIGDNQIGFCCYACYCPKQQNTYHSNRVVIHPDYIGFGLGIKLVNETAKYLVKNYKYRIRATFSSTAMYKARINDKRWKLMDIKLKGHHTKSGGKVFRQAERVRVKAYTFLYLGDGT